MRVKDDAGNFTYGQRDIEHETGLSRPYIRKLAAQIGHQFPRNGIEVKGQLCMCSNCGWFFRKPASRVKRAKHQFCEDICRQAWMKGANHPAWKTGITANTFSSWVKNQAEYRQWAENVLERDNHTCVISGRTDNLEAHHILMKAESESPDKVFDIDNGITLNKEVHQRMHELIREGKGVEESMEQLKKEYQGATV